MNFIISESVKTGECYFIEELDGSLWIAVSYQDEVGLVWTESNKVEDENILQ